MTDYKNLKLIASSSPHIRSSESTRTIMMDVIIAMIPALAMSVFVFGFRALALTLVSVAACVFWEWGYRKLLKKPQSIGDLSAVVTGMLLAFVCPPHAALLDDHHRRVLRHCGGQAAVRRHRLQLPQPRSGGPCRSAGQLCHGHDHLGRAHEQAVRLRLQR